MELDVISDPVVRNVLRKFYRMLLEMYNSEQLAKAVAREVKKEDGARFSKREKLFGYTLSAIVTASAVINIIPHK